MHLFILNFFYRTLFHSCDHFILELFHLALFPSCNLLSKHFYQAVLCHSIHVALFNVALFSYCTFLMLFFSCYAFSIAICGCFIIIIFLWYSFFLLHLFEVAIFSCGTFFMLHLFMLNFLHAALIFCCTLHKQQIIKFCLGDKWNERIMWVKIWVNSKELRVLLWKQY